MDIGSDQTQNVLWRLRRGEVDGLDPGVVVLLNRSRCLDVVELCGAVLVREHGGDEPKAHAATAEGAPGCMVWPALPGVSAEILETQLRDAIEPAKHVLRDSMLHNALIPRRKGDRALRQLMLRLENAESWSAAEVFRELGSTFLKMRYFSAAELMVRRAEKTLPAGPRIRWLLEQIEAETKLRAPPG